MGFFTDIERQSLRIEGMSLHVVGEEEFTPEPALGLDHAAFFIARILDTDVAPVYGFREVSTSRETIERMARDEATFEISAQTLARDFSRLHGTTARDGAFFVFALRTEDPHVRIYSLIKYDYREAIEQAEDPHGQHRLRRIVHALTDDKKAIQKSALVRVVDGQAEATVAARDRAKPAPEIADYFATFLDVERNRSDQDLNRAVLEVLRKTLQESKEFLPNQDVARALQHARGILRDRQEIGEEAIIEAVMAAADNPDDENVRATLERRASQKLRAYKLTGLVFRPDRNVLRRPPLHKLRTTEGVTVIYPDDAEAVTLRRERNLEGNGEVITITTDCIVEDTFVRDPAR
ncbi:nucleoid-associated protein [Xanthomonas arboricola]|uniref:nucleoid-associated protein n=1 Tax=Xanthomonas arboricola TaxID=56448 RepID=UPI000CEE9F09|nr:nucleoid-associated protein [Xanthomonas arboricola]PPT30111.1 hypothetical protein XarbCFBP7614_00555 [Xanthomonas arboricola]